MNSFLYLDEYKMYSISAQIFGGLTEAIIEYSQRKRSDSEEQKGPIGSGRLLADIATEQTGKQELKYLQDYAYTLFEKKLLEDNKLLDLNRDLRDTFRDEINNAALVKVTGQALFTDVPLLTGLMDEFNHIGEALTYITNYGQLSELKNSLGERLEATSDRNQKAALREQVKALTDTKALAKKCGLQQDTTYLKHLSFVINYMMKDSFELRVTLATQERAEICFSSPLRRESLREPCDAIIRKYSRRCEEPLTIVGIVTQGKRDKIASGGEVSETKIKDAQNLKEALLGLANITAGLEDSFFGRMENEYVIDPIAVFRQL